MGIKMSGATTQKITESITQCCSLTVQIIFGLAWTAIGVAMIVVGAMHKNECPAEPYIPIYMIVAGAFSFSFWVLLPLEFYFPTLRKILSGLIGLFCFAWFIAGSVWVFRIYSSSPRMCHNNMYLFAFSILIIQYIGIGIGIISGVISCFCCGISCCIQKV